MATKSKLVYKTAVKKIVTGNKLLDLIFTFKYFVETNIERVCYYIVYKIAGKI
jgi:hypothetical protein